MSNKSLIEDIYSEISLETPNEIISFSGVSEAFSEFDNWSVRVKEVLTCFWSYQFPMADPRSYWGIYHLSKDSYRLDIKRSPNQYGCYVNGKYINEIPNKVLTKEQYDDVCKNIEQQTFDETNESIVESILNKYEKEIDLFDGYMLNEDPTCQMGVDDFIFLGNFTWLQREAWLLNEFKKSYGIPINDKMLEILQTISRSKKLFITFTNMVIIINLT